MEERYYHTKESVAEYIQAAKGYNGSDILSDYWDFFLFVVDKGVTISNREIIVYQAKSYLFLL